MGLSHVALGGTFDHFHKGHRTLLKKAVEWGARITVGITSPEFAGPLAESYETRRDAVVQFMESLGCESYKLVKLDDPFGPATEDESMDGLIVSSETLKSGLELNEARKKKKLKELEIIIVPMINADDGKPISSSRIRESHIDKDGHLL